MASGILSQIQTSHANQVTYKKLTMKDVEKAITDLFYGKGQDANTQGMIINKARRTGLSAAVKKVIDEKLLQDMQKWRNDPARYPRTPAQSFRTTRRRRNGTKKPRWNHAQKKYHAKTKTEG